uniref:Uncharacterized protein n=1 Tax=Craspedostauros australis TaxID=1486917 RepID=A0A7R9ZNV9_9STRA|mmetsp:Transcript_4739/g.12427  ORF Transcript_4739/g.12427 Transcript_4739/m.12427 type:complete len:105 (+) Transcript_4739:50-364(+)
MNGCGKCDQMSVSASLAATSVDAAVETCSSSAVNLRGMQPDPSPPKFDHKFKTESKTVQQHCHHRQWQPHHHRPMITYGDPRVAEPTTTMQRTSSTDVSYASSG